MMSMPFKHTHILCVRDDPRRTTSHSDHAGLSGTQHWREDPIYIVTLDHSAAVHLCARVWDARVSRTRWV